MHGTVTQMVAFVSDDCMPLKDNYNLVEHYNKTQDSSQSYKSGFLFCLNSDFMPNI